MPRIFDCIVFDGQLNALRERFAEYEEIPGLVHVICETEPLCFWENRKRFQPRSRWNCVRVKPWEIQGRNPAEREMSLREYVLHGVNGDPGDVIMFGDVACIPDKDILMNLALRKTALPQDGLAAGYRRDVTTIAELIQGS